ncbi:ComEA family DNA-binding protein [Variovorax sp. RT4R15]|uniref:ComEA family DNA-binding protein n=1 Tax=Variovorax sp. RT4R15 TaxID=3443737 RepID=UPI003F46D552
MLKKIAAALAAMVFAVVSFAAVDVNKGSAADLDGVKGVGPAMSARIIEARKQGQFKDWADLMQRVKGVKGKTAAKLSGEGLTVNGESFKGSAAAVPAKAAKEDVKAKPAAKP